MQCTQIFRFLIVSLAMPFRPVYLTYIFYLFMNLSAFEVAVIVTSNCCSFCASLPGPDFDSDFDSRSPWPFLSHWSSLVAATAICLKCNSFFSGLDSCFCSCLHSHLNSCFSSLVVDSLTESLKGCDRGVWVGESGCESVMESVRESGLTSSFAFYGARGTENVSLKVNGRVLCQQ